MNSMALVVCVDAFCEGMISHYGMPIPHARSQGFWLNRTTQQQISPPHNPCHEAVGFRESLHLPALPTCALLPTFGGASDRTFSSVSPNSNKNSVIKPDQHDQQRTKGKIVECNNKNHLHSCKLQSLVKQHSLLTVLFFLWHIFSLDLSGSWF